MLPGTDLKLFEWQLGLFLKDDRKLIGYFTINGDSTILQRSAQFGLGLREDYRRQGYGTEAVAGMLSYLEENTNIQKATAGCFANNLACAKALGKCRHEKGRVLRRYWLRHGEWQDGFEFERRFTAKKLRAAKTQMKPMAKTTRSGLDSCSV